MRYSPKMGVHPNKTPEKVLGFHSFHGDIGVGVFGRQEITGAFRGTPLVFCR
jgi:hypothetical protein